ncbi:MAG: LysR family transcriptional regulator [bacterium]|nr:LysR family transcriptional regulator [bacterium]
MQLKQLEYLVKIVECGSITQAAQKLYISQPSLTKAISNLEQEYGIRLLNRKSRGIEVTAEGAEFLYYAKGVLAAASTMDHAFFKQEEWQHSRLFIASQQLDFVYKLYLDMYQSCQEEIVHYGLAEMDRQMVTQSVLRGDSDIGILVHTNSDARSFLNLHEKRKLEIHVLERADVYICVGPQSPFYDRDSVTYTETKTCLHLVLDMEIQARQNAYFEQTISKFNKDKLIFFNTISACECFLLQTDALVFIAKWAIACFKDKRIRAIPVVEDAADQPRMYTELVWIKRVIEPLSQTELQFVKKMEQLFQKDSACES